MAQRRVTKDSRNLSQPITVEYGFCCFPVIMSASRLSKVAASRPTSFLSVVRARLRYANTHLTASGVKYNNQVYTAYVLTQCNYNIIHT